MSRLFKALVALGEMASQPSPMCRILARRA